MFATQSEKNLFLETVELRENHNGSRTITLELKSIQPFCVAMCSLADEFRSGVDNSLQLLKFDLLNH